MTQNFSNIERKNFQPRILYIVKAFFRSEWEIKTFSNEDKQRICHKKTYPERTAKGSSLKRMEIIQWGTLKHQEGRNKLRIITIDFHSPLECSKLYLMVETKMLTLSAKVLNVCTGKVKIILLYMWGEERGVEEGMVFKYIF